MGAEDRDAQRVRICRARLSARFDFVDDGIAIFLDRRLDLFASGLALPFGRTAVRLGEADPEMLVCDLVALEPDGETLGSEMISAVKMLDRGVMIAGAVQRIGNIVIRPEVTRIAAESGTIHADRLDREPTMEVEISKLMQQPRRRSAPEIGQLQATHGLVGIDLGKQFAERLQQFGGGGSRCQEPWFGKALTKEMGERAPLAGRWDTSRMCIGRRIEQAFRIGRQVDLRSLGEFTAVVRRRSCRGFNGSVLGLTQVQVVPERIDPGIKDIRILADVIADRKPLRGVTPFTPAMLNVMGERIVEDIGIMTQVKTCIEILAHQRVDLDWRCGLCTSKQPRHLLQHHIPHYSALRSFRSLFRRFTSADDLARSSARDRVTSSGHRPYRLL
ncbi:hypothetical protein V6R86_07570 [Sphingomonas kaistensis]|uniref:Uncharacterized protein n=1 Tax=Sphingomonas kaistensis TaxID=298708 RepID=A0ABZ2G0V5_9SPHN